MSWWWWRCLLNVDIVVAPKGQATVTIAMILIIIHFLDVIYRRKDILKKNVGMRTKEI